MLFFCFKILINYCISLLFRIQYSCNTFVFYEKKKNTMEVRVVLGYLLEFEFDLSLSLTLVFTVSRSVFVSYYGYS